LIFEQFYILKEFKIMCLSYFVVFNLLAFAANLGTEFRVLHENHFVKKTVYKTFYYIVQIPAIIIIFIQPFPILTN